MIFLNRSMTFDYKYKPFALCAICGDGRGTSMNWELRVVGYKR